GVGQQHKINFGREDVDEAGQGAPDSPDRLVLPAPRVERDTRPGRGHADARWPPCARSDRRCGLIAASASLALARPPIAAARNGRSGRGVVLPKYRYMPTCVHTTHRYGT